MEKYTAYIYPYNRKSELGKPKRKMLKNKYESDDEELMDYEIVALKYSDITMDMLYTMGKPLEDVCRNLWLYQT